MMHINNKGCKEDSEALQPELSAREGYGTDHLECSDMAGAGQ